MSTNNRARTGTSRVPELPEIKRQRRLANLLATRRRLAELAAEHHSHGLDDAVELYMLELQVQQTLVDEFPEVFEEQVALWADEELAAGHHPAVMAPTCSLCQAIARRGGFDDPLVA